MAACARGVFCLYRVKPYGQYYLRWFTDDGPREGAIVRLDFKSPSPLPGDKPEYAAEFDLNGKSVFSAPPDAGLRRRASFSSTQVRGFYFLPFSDLDAAAAKLPSDPVPPAFRLQPSGPAR